MRPRPRVARPPTMFQLLIVVYLHCPPAVCRVLWDALRDAPDATTVQYHLAECLRHTGSQRDRVSWLLARLTPQRLLDETERLVQHGRVKRRAIVGFEQRLLDCTTRRGVWK